MTLRGAAGSSVPVCGWPGSRHALPTHLCATCTSRPSLPRPCRPHPTCCQGVEKRAHMGFPEPPNDDARNQAWERVFRLFEENVKA